MKTLFKISLILFLAGIVLSACNSSLSITKRRYTKGYYVHHNHKHASPKIRETAKAAPVQGEKEQFLALAKASATSAADLSEPEQTQGQVLTAGAGAPKKKNAEGSGGYSNKSNSLIPVEFVKDPVKSFKTLSEKLNTAGPAGEALSLLWILILVLLLAYIAGLLLDSFGLGWVIHILLVIILVLFILWLLRIV